MATKSYQCPSWCEIPTPHAATHEALWGSERGVEVWLQSLDGVHTVVKVRDSETGRTFWPPLDDVPALATIRATLGDTWLAECLRRCHRIAEAENTELVGEAKGGGR